MEYKPNDKIIITLAGQVYSSANELAIAIGAHNWVYGRGWTSGHVKDGMKGIIIKKINKDQYLVQLSDGYQYIFDIQGLKLYKDKLDLSHIKPYGIVAFLNGEKHA